LLNAIDDNVPLQLSGDNKRLREILMNLIENAIKFTQQGQVIIRVRSISKNGLKPVLSFEVEDSGIGIAKEQMGQLFYSVPDRGFNNEIKKSGRGLVICRKHAELMGGKIEVKSNPGAGSSFVFMIQFDHSLTSLLQNVKLKSESLKAFENKNVLVIDDNITSRNILIKKLKAWKIVVTGADSGMQAFEILSQNKSFDLVLVDLNMPQVDGLQFARVIKKENPDLRLVLMNPAGQESYRLEEELFAAVLTKPLRQNDLRDNLLATFKKEDTDRNCKTNEMENNFSEKYPLQILIAEDNLVNQKIAMKILKKLGYQPSLANNGREALEMADQCDIILMDVQMPEMDGLEATKLIRSKQSVQPVIVAMTANVLQGDRDACIQAGMDDYISKPIDLDELLRQLEKWSLIIKERQKV